MSDFRTTTHLSEILEESNKQPVVLFKYSSECGSSTFLYEKLEKKILDKTIIAPIYLVTVQKMPALSEKISEMFDIKHESPQIIILNKGKVTYTAHHDNINLDHFVFK